MFMRLLKPKTPPQPVGAATPADAEDALAYFTPERPGKAPRDMSAIEQMYAYYSAD